MKRTIVALALCPYRSLTSGYGGVTLPSTSAFNGFPAESTVTAGLQ